MKYEDTKVMIYPHAFQGFIDLHTEWSNAQSMEMSRRRSRGQETDATANDQTTAAAVLPSVTFQLAIER